MNTSIKLVFKEIKWSETVWESRRKEIDEQVDNSMAWFVAERRLDKDILLWMEISQTNVGM